MSMGLQSQEMTRQRNNNNKEENGNHGRFLKGSDLIRRVPKKIFLENELGGAKCKQTSLKTIIIVHARSDIGLG